MFRSATILPINSHTKSANHPHRIVGLQARILLALHCLFRPFYLRPLRQCFYHLRLPVRGGWCFFGRMVLAHLRLRVLLYCLVRGRARLCLSHLRRPILHLQIPCARRMGPRNSLVDGLVESSWPDRWSRIDRIWLRPIASGCCFNGRRLQRLYSYGPSNRRSHGCFHYLARGPKQSEYSSTREDDQNICYIPSSNPLRMLRHPAGHV